MALAFLRRQWTPIPYPEQDLTSQVIIVTGSNTGLGLEAAKHFVRLNAAKVIIACRSVKKGEEAVKAIEAATKRAGVCEVWQLDMEDFESVKAFAARADKLDRLDVMLENAGISNMKWVWSEKANTELTIAVNVIGTFLLAILMLPILRRNGKRHGIVPRLTITSSDVHLWANFAERHEANIFETLANKQKSVMSDRYNVSKLLEVLMIRALAEHTSSGPHTGEKVIINNVSPGLCNSELMREAPAILKPILKVVMMILARTTEVGGRTLVFAAQGGQETHGAWMSEAVVTNTSSFVRSEEGRVTQERVYKELLGVLERLSPGIGSNI